MCGIKDGKHFSGFSVFQFTQGFYIAHCYNDMHFLIDCGAFKKLQVLCHGSRSYHISCSRGLGSIVGQSTCVMWWMKC
jgi:hypothetical protein